MKKKIISFTLVSIGFLVGASALSALAQTWTAPTCAAPNCNTAPPVLTDTNANQASTQTRYGLLSLQNLQVNNLQIINGTPATGDVLTSDASGNATWQVSSTGTYHAISPTTIFSRGNDLNNSWSSQFVDSTPGGYDCPSGTGNGILPENFTTSFPVSVPPTAKAVQVEFMSYSNGGGHVSIYASDTSEIPPLLPKITLAIAVDGTNDNSAGVSMNSSVLPYTPQIVIGWDSDGGTIGGTTYTHACGTIDAVRAVVLGYWQ